MIGLTDLLKNFNDDIQVKILNPKWGETDRVHDWRNYIPGTMQDLWDKFSIETKVVAYLIAEQGADGEVWD